MELIKQNKALSIAILILIAWLLGLTVFQFILFNSNKNLSTKNTPDTLSAPSSIPRTNSDINPTTKISAFTENGSGKIYGKYNPEDFDYFGGLFLTQITSNGNTVLVVPGYLSLKSEILAKETDNGVSPAPVFQMETKYIAIGKNTKITDDQGAVAKIEDLGPEDYLKIVPYEAAEYPATYMLADTIVITKKIWPEGENPFK